MDPRELLTLDGLGVVATALTGGMAAYAAFLSRKVSVAERQRAERAELVAVRAFCFRATSEIWQAGDALKGEAERLDVVLRGNGLGVHQVNQFARYFEADPLPILRASLQEVLLLPRELPNILSSVPPTLDQLKELVLGIRGSEYMGASESGVPILTEEGVRAAMEIVSVAKSLSIAMIGAAEGMEKIAGRAILPRNLSNQK